MESWRTIPGWETIYQVSDQGNVKRLAGSPRCTVDRVVKPMLNARGYLTVGLTSPNTKQRPYVIHRLVLESFVGLDSSKPFANHKNGNKTDNRLCNLEWVTHAENISHAYNTGLHGRYIGSRASNSKLSEAQAMEILQCFRDGMFAKEIAKKFGIKPKTALSIANGYTWPHLDRSNMGTRRTGSHKLTVEQVVCIKNELRKGGNHCHIAKNYGVTSGAIWAISDGRTWKHVS